MTPPTEDRDWKKDIDILAAQGHIDADGVEKVFELIAAAEARGYERGKNEEKVAYGYEVAKSYQDNVLLVEEGKLYLLSKEDFIKNSKFIYQEDPPSISSFTDTKHE